MGGMIERLFVRYRHTSYVTRLRARFLLQACVAVIIVLPFIIAYDVYLSFAKEAFGHTFYWPIIAPLAVFFIVCIIIALLIVKGRFSIAAHLFLIVSQCVLWSIVFIDKSGPLERMDTVAVIVAGLSMSPLVITRKPLLIPLYSAITILVSIVFIRLHGAAMGLSHSAMVDFVGDTAIASVVVGIMAYNLFSINKAALDRSEESRGKLAIANNDLIVANEELEATNEELAATMEELTVTNQGIEAQNRELIESKRMIGESLEEKNVLIKEIHHRVKNNMQIISSLLNMQCQNVEDPLMRQPLNDAVSRIRSIALIHEKIYKAENFSRIDMSSYIADLLDENIQLCSKKSEDIQFLTRLEPINLSVNQAIPCGILINEIITNSIKHGCVDEKGCSIEVEMYASDGVMTIIISDSGPGLDHDIRDSGSANTMGMQLINALAKQLNAEIAVRVQNGTTFTIRFNIKK